MRSVPEILVIGEALIDIVHRADGSVEEAPGGSPANVAVTLGRLDHAPLLVTAFGTDKHGEILRKWLEESLVEVQRLPRIRTATSVADIGVDGSASYQFDLEWSLPTGLAINTHGIVHTGSIASYCAPGADVVRKIIQNMRAKALVTYDPNIRPSLIGDPSLARLKVEELVAYSDVVKASDEDLLWLYPDIDPVAAASAWQRTGPAIVVVTQGPAGATAVYSGGTVTVPGVSTTVVDSVGAGDTFMGAVIHGLLEAGFCDAASREALHAVEPEILAQLLRVAATAAAVTVSRPGTDPPHRLELEQNVLSSSGQSDDPDAACGSEGGGGAGV
ncbi:carbohydrate kinase family protein [Microbacterium sp. YY-01]|uniref:carbohydrate kinase family protein n=1 Tax=Microbacterium sp. YY-01 TaxID=3421634 RepID=UPI003D162F77